MKIPPSCTCTDCVGACHNVPGWFAHGEAEKAAKLLGLSFAWFKRRYLVVDYWVGGARLYAPGKIDVPAPKPPHPVKHDYAFVRGTCVFLKNDRCRIHEAKPFECRMSGGCAKTRHPNSYTLRESIQKTWLDAGAPLGRG